MENLGGELSGICLLLRMDISNGYGFRFWADIIVLGHMGNTGNIGNRCKKLKKGPKP